MPYDAVKLGENPAVPWPLVQPFSLIPFYFDLRVKLHFGLKGDNGKSLLLFFTFKTKWICAKQAIKVAHAQRFNLKHIFSRKITSKNLFDCKQGGKVV